MLEVTERGAVLRFSFEDVLRYHGGHSPGGAAIAYQVLERALPELDGCGRREIAVATAFGGPGARDAFECVLRAVTDGRYTVTDALARPERGRVLERFAWELSCGGRTVRLELREGFVDEEFVDLARADRDAEQEARLTVLKRARGSGDGASRGPGGRAQPALTTASIISAPRASATDTR